MGHQYVSRPKGVHKPHSMPAAEIRLMYIKVGWIGERKVEPPALRLAPFFDTGPGPDIGR